MMVEFLHYSNEASAALFNFHFTDMLRSDFKNHCDFGKKSVLSEILHLYIKYKGKFQKFFSVSARK